MSKNYIEDAILEIIKENSIKKLKHLTYFMRMGWYITLNLNIQ